MKEIKYQCVFEADFRLLEQLKKGHAIPLAEATLMFTPHYSLPERNQYVGEFEDGKQHVILEIQGRKIVVFASEKYVANPILHREAAAYAGQPNGSANLL